MIHRDSIEFTAALALGAALGMWVALAILPDGLARRVQGRRKRPGPRSFLGDSGAELVEALARIGRGGRVTGNGRRG